jgi:MoaA/NifB/PqqE/SkfB family radical SAM enzyme
MIPCPLPWTGLAVNPDGAVKNCAMSQDTLGNLKSAPIDLILSGSKNRQIRNSLLSGQWPANCRLCQQREEIDPEFSNRAYQLNLHRDLDNKIYQTNEHQLQQLDLRWSNTCNYACVYCSPSLSSQWAQELGQTVNIDKSNFTALKEYVYPNLGNLREVYLAGGEPLLIKENNELLNQLYQVNPDCLVRITTNLSNLSTGVYQTIRQFKHVQWEVSVEATGAQFEYVRYPGVWSIFEDNLKRLIQEWPQEQIGLTMNYFLLTTDIVKTGEYLIGLGIDANRTAVHYLTDPKYLDARNFSDKILSDLVSDLNRYSPTTTFGNSLHNCAEFLTKPFDKNTANVVYSLNTIDKRRNLDFTKTFPNLINMLKA